MSLPLDYAPTRKVKSRFYFFLITRMLGLKRAVLFTQEPILEKSKEHGRDAWI